MDNCEQLKSQQPAVITIHNLDYYRGRLKKFIAFFLFLRFLHKYYITAFSMLAISDMFWVTCVSVFFIFFMLSWCICPLISVLDFMFTVSEAVWIQKKNNPVDWI